ncbi:MAG: transmembrane amino acid transporter protein-domain-containing protein [Piptocephalis tieghemiana]|nr:MAG: transmembrane amino acid transporter protein-domain-containing protein [Piptocephalis tieghemiana]
MRVDDDGYADDLEAIKSGSTREEEESGGIPAQGTASEGKAIFLLIKAFVGTGVLFLPHAFGKGGLWFSAVVLSAMAGLSLFSYLLLVKARAHTPGGGSFGEIAGTLFGPVMKGVVQTSIVLSQIGFCCAYIIFIASNLRTFFQGVTDCAVNISVVWYIVMLFAVFVPFALIRRIEKLGFTSLISEAFILFGIIYILYYDISYISANGFSDTTVAFNSRDWSLFIGTAVYSYEGIGLVIPITESMKRPEKFPRVLVITLSIVLTLFLSVGMLSYVTFGDKTQTMVVNNMPQNSGIVSAIQILYAIAIIFSVPLQMFPAIVILEKGSFGPSRSGRVSMKWKWSKNLFRACLVGVCILISAVGSSNLDIFISLVGSFACIPLCFLYPPIFHLKAVKSSRFMKLCDWALLILGFIIMIYSTVMAIIEIIHPNDPEPAFDLCSMPSA